MENATERVYQLLKEGGPFYCATVDAQGVPHIRPLGFLMQYEGGIYIGLGSQKPVYQQVTANPNIAICSFNKGKWLRINAVAVPDMRDEVQDYMYEISPQTEKMYPRGGEPKHATFRLTQCHVQICAGPEAEELDF